MWMEAFTVYQTVVCASHPHRWFDLLPKFKLLIIVTACHSMSHLWLESDLAFWKVAVAPSASGQQWLT